MSIWLQGGAKKPSGGRYRYSEPKRKKNTGKVATLTTIGKDKVNKIKGLGSVVKNRALQLSTVNVYDAKKKKSIKATIEDVVNNPANRHYIRMDVLTKGAILKTNLGYVRITSRPAQNGLVNGVFTEFKEEVKKESKKHEDKK